MSLGRFAEYAADHIEHAMQAGERLPNSIELAADKMIAGLLEGGRILCAGTDAGDLLAHYFSRLLVDQLELQRPPLPALWLDAANTGEMGARQLGALAGSQDVLLLIHLQAQPCPLLASALEHQLPVIYLHRDGQSPASQPHLLTIAVPGQRRARLHEGALLALHGLCDHIDTQLFGA